MRHLFHLAELSLSSLPRSCSFFPPFPLSFFLFHPSFPWRALQGPRAITDWSWNFRFRLIIINVSWHQLSTSATARLTHRISSRNFFANLTECRQKRHRAIRILCGWVPHECHPRTDKRAALESRGLFEGWKAAQVTSDGCWLLWRIWDEKSLQLNLWCFSL